MRGPLEGRLYDTSVIVDNVAQRSYACPEHPVSGPYTHPRRRGAAMALEEQLLTASLVNTFHEARAVLQNDLGPMNSLQEAEESGE